MELSNMDQMENQQMEAGAPQRKINLKIRRI